MTKKGGDLLLLVTHTGQHGSSTQPVNFEKVKQIAVLYVDLVNQYLELALIQAAGKDVVDDLHHNRHDVNEVGRIGAQSLFVNDESESCVRATRNFAHETGICLAGVSRAGLQCNCRAGWRAGR